MPLPIICASEALCQFALCFRLVFTKPQWKYFVTVLLALVQSEDRRTLTGLLRKVIAPFSLAGLSRFLSRAPWSEALLAQLWLAHFRLEVEPTVQAEHWRQEARRPKRRGGPRATSVTGYLLLDDSTHAKPKGRQMKGLDWHYATTAQRPVKGHSLFMGLYVLVGRRCPLQPQLYRTKPTCEKDHAVFRSKVDLAYDAIESFVPVERTRTHILVDAWYTCRRLWLLAHARGFQFSGGVKSNRTLQRVGPDGMRYWQSLSAYAGELSPEQFQSVVWPAQDGGRPVWVHCVRARVHRLGVCQLLIVREQAEASLEQTRYFVTSLLHAEAQAIMNVLAIRWDIETLFEDLKELLGTDHYQLMDDRAIRRFWTLSSCVYLFLDERRAAMAASDHTHVSIGQARQRVQRDHQLHLLQWLQQAFQNGCAPLDVQFQFA